MSEFRIACPSCQQHLMCDDSHRGTQFPCPNCGTTIAVPATGKAPPPAGLKVSAPVAAATPGRGTQPRFVPGRQGGSRPRGKNWLTTIMLAWFLGYLGVDRFYSGRIGLGIGKLLTFGACGVWSLVDVLLLLTKNYQDGQGYSLKPARRSDMAVALSIIGITLLIQLGYAYATYRELAGAVERAQEKMGRIMCVNNLKQVGLAFRIFANDHGDEFPFNVPVANGGTLEFRRTSADGFDANAFRHFQVLSNEIYTTKGLICPDDTSRVPASDWTSLSAGSVTYQLRTGPEVKSSAVSEVLVQCPIHGHKLYVDGSVVEGDSTSPAASRPIEVNQPQGFASPQAVFETMKTDPQAIGLYPAAERPLVAYTSVVMARFTSIFESDAARKQQLEQGFKELIARHNLTDTLEFSSTEDENQIREIANRAFKNTDLDAFWMDLQAYLKQSNPTPGKDDTSRPVRLKDLAIDGDEARGVVVSSDETEEPVVFVRTGGGWFLSFEKTHMNPDDPFAETTEMTLLITFDSEASLNAATAKGLLEAADYDRSSTVSLERAATPLQAYLTFMIAISADREAITDTVRNVRGVTNVKRSLGKEFDESMKEAMAELPGKIREAIQTGDVEITQVDGGSQAGPAAAATRSLPTGSPVSPLPDPGNLQAYRGMAGSQLYFSVRGASAGPLWGTDTYTDDSQLAVAAVHAGVLSPGQTGIVQVTMLAGQSAYQGSERNGVRSGPFGNWVGSFRIKAPVAGQVGPGQPDQNEIPTGELSRLAFASVQNPSDTLLALRLAALQSWFEQDTAHAQHSKRMLKWAENTDDPAGAERAAKIVCLRPIASIVTQQDALNLARKAVEQGASHPSLPWFKMSLGMAEYRLGNYAAAERTLREALIGARALDESSRSRIEGPCNFYLAMILKHQGRGDSARDLFRRTTLAMRLPPAHLQNSVALRTHHDDLVVWLAHREAARLLGETGPGAP